MKTYILLINFTTISLFIDQNKEIKEAEFTNLGHTINNAITYDISIDNLYFDPSHTPFDINYTSMLSRGINFMGYSFKRTHAIETSIEQMIRTKMIPDFEDNDKFLVIFDSVFCEFDYLNWEENQEPLVRTKINKNKTTVSYYCLFALYQMIVFNLGDRFNTGIISYTPYFTYISTSTFVLIKPFYDKDKILEYEDSQNHFNIPDEPFYKLKNKCSFGEIYGFKYDLNISYQNREYSASKDELMKQFEPLKPISEPSLDETLEEQFTKYPNVILFKNSSTDLDDLVPLNKIKNLHIATKEENDLLCKYIIRMAIRTEEINTSPFLKAGCLRVLGKRIKDPRYYLTEYGQAYFDPELIRAATQCKSKEFKEIKQLFESINSNK